MKTVALIGAICLTAGWLLASLLSPPVANLQTLPARRAQSTAPQQQTPETSSEVLRLNLDRVMAAPTPRRNPFRFGTGERVSGSSSSTAAAAAPTSEMAPVTPTIAGPRYTLAGIGVSETARGEVKTAIVSDGVTVHLLKAGDTIGGYQVTEVTETTATLIDALGAQYVLRLRN